jgi:hypothetical protein
VEEDIEDQSISAKSNHHTLKSLLMRQDHKYASAPLLPNKPPPQKTLSQYLTTWGLPFMVDIVYDA